MITISNQEFNTIQKLIFNEVGIDIASSKKLLVQSRLLKRILFYKLTSYLEYIRLVGINPQERIEMINLITTNETYFFREMSHFDFIQKVVIPKHPSGKKFRVWSAAASVGAEAYSLAMLLADSISITAWEVVGTDINTEVISKARVGLYPVKWLSKIPIILKEKYFLMGKGRHEGQCLIDRGLIKNMRFTVGNLMEYNPNVGQFDVVFLRNVLIYFNDKTKENVVNNVLRNLHIGGYLIISLTENLNMTNNDSLESLGTSIYRRIK